MAFKYICDQTATEVEVTTLDEMTMYPKLPSGWVQENIKNPDGSFSSRHFSSPEAQLAYYESPPEE